MIKMMSKTDGKFLRKAIWCVDVTVSRRKVEYKSSVNPKKGVPKMDGGLRFFGKLRCFADISR